jgi:tetratricopeptide (TPR) repeat protein
MKEIIRSGHRPNPTSGPKRRPAPIGQDRFRIGVLPFLAGRIPKDEDLAFSVSRRVAAAIARFRHVDIIPPTSSMPQSTAIRAGGEAAQFEDLDYVVDGAVSRDGERVQVSVRLVDLGQYARTIWSQRFVLAPDELNRWSELTASLIVAGIDPTILFLDGQPKRRTSDRSTDILHHATPLMYSMERRKYEEAGRLLNRALELEPDNATVVAWTGYWQVFHVGQGWAHDIAAASAIAQAHARTAMRLDPDDAETLIICAHIYSFLNRDYDTALYYFDRAQRLNPDLERIWLWSALTYCYAGKPGFALQQLKRYRDLTSSDPHHLTSQGISSVAYAFAGDYEKAVEFGRRTIQINPAFVNGYKPLIASLGHLGRREEAEPYVAKLLALEPNFTVERFGRVYPIKYEADRAHYMAGLRLGGVPER